MMAENIIIRKGQRGDIPVVHQLVYELAKYEKAEYEVETTPEQYERDSFGENPLFDFLVAEHPSEGIIGIALFYFGYSTWKGKKLYLDDLVVTEAWRRKGVGQMLFDQLAKYALEQEAHVLSWQVLDWNTPAIRMYEKIGAYLDPEWVNCRMSRKQMEQWLSR
ncbi:MAG: GNAT family N-acetyltransferase [Bacteroidia bacterium]|nr:GNAT family N-acetyltransferase [Bacteroidia bacterium]